MQDADLFLELAAIAGVFVGFGALIAVRSGGASEAAEVGMMRGMVSWAVVTILAAVVPVTLARYDLTDHEVWALSSVLVLVGIFGVGTLQVRTAEYRAGMVARIERSTRRHMAMEAVANVGFTAVLLLVLILILLGLAPDLEAALYFTAVVLLLVGDSWFLLELVFAQRLPAEA